MQKFYICIFIFSILCSCSSNKNEGETNAQTLLQKEMNSTDPSGNTIIPDSSFGNVRIAFLTNHKFKKPANIRSRKLLGIKTAETSLSTVLVHKSNKKYLQLEKEYNGYDYETQIPLSGFKYTARTLPLTLNRSIVIVEDNLMEQILELAKSKVAFYNNAKSIPASYLSQSNWPTKDTILIEQDGKYFALEKPDDLNNLKGESGRAYRALKLNILQSRSAGHIVQIINVRKSRRQ